MVIRKAVELQDENERMVKLIQLTSPNLKEIEEYIEAMNDIDPTAVNKQDSLQLDVIGYLGIICKAENVRVSSVEGPSVEPRNNYQIETIHIVLEGDFISVLKVVQKFGKNRKLSNIVSAGFFIKEQIRHEQIRLFCNVYVQNIIFNQ